MTTASKNVNNKIVSGRHRRGIFLSSKKRFFEVFSSHKNIAQRRLFLLHDNAACKCLLPMKPYPGMLSADFSFFLSFVALLRIRKLSLNLHTYLNTYHNEQSAIHETWRFGIQRRCACCYQEYRQRYFPTCFL